MKFLFYAAFSIFSLILSPNAYAGTEWPASCKGVPPHYLRNIRQPDSQIEKFVERQKIWRTFGSEWRGITNHAANTAEEFQGTLYGKNVKILFWQYSRAGNKVLYYTTHGIEEISLDELQCVKDDIFLQLKRSVDYMADELKNLTPEVLKRVSEKLGVSVGDLQKALPKPLADDPTITLAEYMDWPILEPKDFMGPKDNFTLNFGSGNQFGIEGATWLDTSMVFYHTIARIEDHNIGKPLVLIHELNHTNHKLQNTPLSDYFDVELFAALPEGTDESMITSDFLSWFYLADLQEIVHVFYNFDTARAWKEISGFSAFGAAELDEKKLEVYAERVNFIQRDLKKFIMETLFPEFYSDPLKWAGINHKAHDDNMAFKLIFSRYYHPTILGGYEKTAKWLDKNDAVLAEISKEAWNTVGQPRKLDKDQTKSLEELRSFAYSVGLTDADLQRFMRIYGLRFSSEKNLSLEQVKMLLRSFLLSSGRKGEEAVR